MKRYLKLCFCVAYLLAGFCQNVFGQQPLDAAYMSGSEVTCVPETQMQMDTVFTLKKENAGNYWVPQMPAPLPLSI